MRRIFHLDNKNEWNQWFMNLPVHLRDINYSPDYYDIFEKSDYGKAECYIFSNHEGFIYYPYLVNNANLFGLETEIPCWDIQGAYGLNGPVASVDDNNLFSEFSNDFLLYCKETGIVSEFIRFNPVINNHVIPKYVTPVYSNDVIIIDLSKTEDELWMNSYSPEKRRNVRKAIHYGLTFKIIRGKDLTEEYLDAFISLYYKTMQRVNAESFYFFRKEFFIDFSKLRGDCFSVLFVYYGTKIISVYTSVHMNEHAYGFLAANDTEFAKLQSSNYAIHNFSLFLKDLGVKYFHIGGGVTKGDSIYSFKQGFNRNSSNKFHIGKVIHNEPVYKELIRRWESESSPEKIEKLKNKLLRYRD
jgi:hypothetical protein